MAGTIPLSMTQQFDIYGKPLSGGQLYIIQAGTVSTPQDAYQDAGLTIKQPYPMTLDAAGRVPQFFVADGTIKIRLQDKVGVVQLAADSVLVIGPSAGGGGGAGAVDPTQLISTGMMMFRHGVGVISGFVRLNNLTIGSATSGATERANADTQALYLFLWPDTSLAVGGGRGASALADWTANKPLAVPDWRSYALGALDDMGNAAAGRLTAGFFGSNPTVLGAVGGGESIIQTAAQMPAHFHTASIYDPGHTHSVNQNSFWTTASGGGGVGGGGNFGTPGTTSISINANSTGVRLNSSNGLDTTYSVGGGAAMRTIGPRKLVTFYMKL